MILSSGCATADAVPPVDASGVSDLINDRPKQRVGRSLRI